MGTPKQIHFLVVDDEKDISNLICLFLGATFSSTFTVVQNGKAAVELLIDRGSDFDMVISDFNMNLGNGQLVFDYVIRNKPEIPFVLVTSDAWTEHSDFHQYPFVGYVSKPFSDDVLINEVQRLVKLCNLQTDSEHFYVGVTIESLASISHISQPLHVKLNEEKYVRIINKGGLFTNEDLDKYRKKGIHTLYIEKSQFSDYIKEFSHKVLNDMLMRGFQGPIEKSFELSVAVQEVIQGAAKVFGLSTETQQLAQRNLELVKTFSERNTGLESIFNWASFSSQEYSYIHSILICYITSDVASSIEFKTPHAAKILALASCFHDLTLENHQVKNEGRFVRAISLQSNMNKEDLTAVKEHPVKGAELISKWPLCPTEVQVILKQHHERPDGSGFPNNLIADEIHELSACFILCEDLVKNYLELKDRSAVEKYFLSQEKIYSGEPFQRIYEFLVQKIKGNFKKAV